MFDTFEGNPVEDELFDIQNGFNSEEFLKRAVYYNTSEEIVLKRMDYPEKCIVRKGYFPSTIPDKEEKYVFVAIGCGLYAPTIAGLEYFYPRLEKGGFIMVGEYYRDGAWKGSRQAVKDYEREEKGLIKIPMADMRGSVLITKK